MQVTYFLKIDGTRNRNGIPVRHSWDARLPYPCDHDAVIAETERKAGEINFDAGWSLVFLEKL